MNILQLSEPLVASLALTLIHFLWQGSAIALTLALTVQFGGVRRNDSRYNLSLLALVAMIASPIVTFAIVKLPTAIAPTIRDFQGVVPSSAPPPTIAHGSNPRDSATVNDLGLDVSRHLLGWSQWMWNRWQSWVINAWIAGVALLSVRLLIGGIGVWRIRHRGIDAPCRLANQNRRLAAELGIACPELKVSHRVQEAIALGFLRPMILLPAAWVTQMPPDMLEAVLAHELAHIRRHDLWINLFQRIVETLLFYHPAVWWLSRRLRIERELCCDELVVRLTQNPLRYAETLEYIGRLSLTSRPATFVVSILGCRSMLAVRIRNILRLPPVEYSSWSWLNAAALLLLAGFGLWSLASTSEVSADVEQSPWDDTSIVAVTFSGNNIHTGAELANLVKTRPGSEVMRGQIRDDVETLIRTRWFSRVEPIVRTTNEGNVLTFNVIERSVVRSVEYRSNKNVSTAILNKVTELKPGQPFDVSINKECVRRIENYYRENGFSFVTVGLERGHIQSDPDCDVVFLIGEGPKVKVTRIDFEDARVPDALRPENNAVAASPILLLSSGMINPHSEADDVEFLQTYYHRLGYFDVRVAVERTPSEDRSKVQMNYRIVEGQRYRVGAVSATENEILSPAEISDLITLRPGAEFNERHLIKDVDVITTELGARGYLFAKVTPVRKLMGKPGHVDIVYKIAEGKKYRVRTLP